ncbi:MAG: diguanylate cyclase [Lachnospiraceae bacterium]|nr:diguanylate cyclase [Lachnospiraceae bacterium]
MDVYTFCDIFDIEIMQKLIDSLSAALEVGIRIRGPHGERFAQDNDFCQLCRTVKNSEPGYIFCEESDLLLSAYHEQSPYICRCNSAGLTAASINIMVDGTHVASILAGQVRLTEDMLSDEECIFRARSLQLDENEFLSHIHRLPLISKARFELILNTLSQLAEQLSQLGQKNLYLKSIISSLENQELIHQKEREVLEKLAETDSMTGLYNHRKFNDVFSQYTSDKDLQICLVSADANYLKLMNDVFGHDAGDMMLKNIANIMANLAKKDWLVARCGGDEFRVILPDTSLDTAKDYCQHVARRCSEDSSLAFPLSVALGAAEWDRETETLFGCFTRADEEMYRNKAILKQETHIPDLMMERLFGRQILNREVVELESDIVYHFSLYIGFSEEHARETSIAAHYQDIGMAKLPEYFVVKGQNKSSEEKLQIQAHVTYGYYIFRQFEELYNLANVILSSHENWDGNSYPKSLKEYQIPLESRILRITNNYAYWIVPTYAGTNLTKAEAKERLVRFSGSMYDPNLVVKFIQFIDTEYN